MRILVIGSGGREHALCQKLAESSLVNEIYVSPGNAGITKTLPKLQVKNVRASDAQSLLQLALDLKIDLTMVGPENILAEGIVDLFQKNNLMIVGPTTAAGRLESSKAFAKKVMLENNVPTATYAEFTESEKALKFIEKSNQQKMVVKCDSLAAGKGVIVCQNKEEAKKAVLAFMQNKYLGENVDHLIIEDFLEGQEVSAFALCDGEDFVFIGTACDHKRLKDNDQGPNTGGMGVFSPANIFNEADEEWVGKNIFSPMLKGMKKLGTPFKGILFAGLMKTASGWKVIEFNVRFGDPETQALMPLINEDFVPWLISAAKGELAKTKNELNRNKILMKPLKAVHVVMAAHGYPGTEGEKIRSGDIIQFDTQLELNEQNYLYFAGVASDKDHYVTKGGRVLGITSLAETYSMARKEAYEQIHKIKFKGAQYRADIGRGL